METSRSDGHRYRTGAKVDGRQAVAHLARAVASVGPVAEAKLAEAAAEAEAAPATNSSQE